MTDVIEVSTTILAPPEMVYAAVADVTRMGEWSPENRGAVWVNGATAAVPGAQFKGRNSNGWRSWSTRCTVVTASPGREISWEVRVVNLPIALWRYRFTAAGDGATTVTESVEDRRGRLIRTVAPLTTGVADRQARNRQTMQTTLARLKGALEGAT